MSELESQDIDQASISLNLDITTRLSTSTTGSEGTLGDAEYAISSLRIYAFDSDNSLDHLYYVEYSEPLTRDITVSFQVTKALSKDLYVVINEPSSMFDALESVTSPSDLKGIAYTMAGAITSQYLYGSSFDKEDFVIPMIGSQSIDAQENSTVTIGVTRAVARVDLYLDKNEISSNKVVKLTSATTLSVAGVTYSSTLLEPATLPAPSSTTGFSVASAEVTLSTEEDDYSTSKRVLSFYTAERTYDKAGSDAITINIDKLEIDDVSTSLVDSQITLGIGEDITSELTAINRNYVYEIYATYNGKNVVVADNYVIQPWEEVVIDGDIEGVTMAVENVVAMDWLLNGNTYVSPYASFGANAAVDIYLPQVTGTYVQEGFTIPEFEFVKCTFPDVSAGATYDLADYCGDYISYLDWIDKAELVFTSAYTGYVQCTYKHGTVHYLVDEFPIRFYSDNVVKQSKAVYDNGYVPFNMLPDFAQDATGGLIFSKRGGYHPRDNDEILFGNGTGYYLGEKKVKGSEADAFCKTLGDMWYVPSSDIMLKAQKCVRELGVSYRLQNTGDGEGGYVHENSYYWSSTEDPNNSDNYLAVEFTRDVDSQETISVDADEELFVRCIINLY